MDADPSASVLKEYFSREIVSHYLFLDLNPTALSQKYLESPHKNEALWFEQIIEEGFN